MPGAKNGKNGKKKRDAALDLIDRVEGLVERVERLLPPPAPAVDWSAPAYRWRRGTRAQHLEAIVEPHRIHLDDLRGIDHQKQELGRNTRQFLAALPANNALLWGSRGTGKSSLIKALLTEHAGDGLRLVEVDKQDLIDLPDLIDALRGRRERFVLFCDDLSFEADDPSYKALKAALDGSLCAPPENVLIYATSNRRHLLPEYMQENLEARARGGEIHHGEAVEEKISLSERFGLWLSFHPFRQEQYLDIAGYWLSRFGVGAETIEAAREHALRWALARGSRSGRSAYQFARDFAGTVALEGGAGP